MIVVGGTASGLLSKSLAAELDCELAKTEIRRFPDQECYVRLLTEVKGEDVIVVQTAYPDPNAVELFLLQDAVREAGAAGLTTVVPYFGYARQDRAFEPGEAVSARAMARHIGLESDRVLTIDIHNTRTLGDFTRPVENLSAMGVIGEFLRGEGVGAIVSPDEGSKERASVAAKAAHCDWDFLEKNRIDDSTVEIKPKNLDVKGKVVAIVDDIIATGGTVIMAAQQLRGQGASRVIAACTHGLYTGGAIERLEGTCDTVVSTDTLERPTSKITVASVVSGALLGGA
jgi:ribose-phosphate pyrophosphokinase